jgi:hypothetical protein
VPARRGQLGGIIRELGRSVAVADINVESLTGGAVQPLREQVRGRVITGTDEGYDEARAVHNGMFDKRPLAVLMAEQVGDVVAAVRFARENGRMSRPS